MNQTQRNSLNPLLLNIVSYRKSGLSLNHIVGCSLNCAYCVRHFFDNFEMKEPHMLCTDEEAVNQLVNHKFFISNITPIQIFNRATDPFLRNVKIHTHEILRMLDELGLKNTVLVITRAKVTKTDMEQLEKLKNLNLSLLVTYSGIIDQRIEPIAKSRITEKSIVNIATYKKKTKLILYWRPIVAGWNDDNASFARVFNVAQYADSIVYTGYYHRPENYAYLQKIGLEIQYNDEFARRKFLPKELENKILAAYNESKLKVPLFRKTSCGVVFAQKLPDYNGHWGVNEICNICPLEQQKICWKHYKMPTKNEFQKLLDRYNYNSKFLIEGGHIWTENLGEERRYHLQHILGYQIWDIEKPHFRNQHGRSPFGQLQNEEQKSEYEKLKIKFNNEVINDDD
ncbi:MAG: hypothetical protein EHM58_01225 [Ignavibacteriae bacterium]|nr:MAG: hypothetical protein EHM58_01225 [Ignavibacteriota bacterium]